MDKRRPISQLLALCTHPDSRVTLVKKTAHGEDVFLRFKITDRRDGTVAEGSREFPLDLEFDNFLAFEGELWATDDLVEMDPDPFPHVSLLWVVPPLVVASTLGFVFAAYDCGLLTGMPFLIAIGITGNILGLRHSLLLAALCIVVQNPLTIHPLLTWTIPEPIEYCRAAVWMVIALLTPWLTANLYRLQSAIVGAEQAIREDLKRPMKSKA